MTRRVVLHVGSFEIEHLDRRLEQLRPTRPCPTLEREVPARPVRGKIWFVRGVGRNTAIGEFAEEARRSGAEWRCVDKRPRTGPILDRERLQTESVEVAIVQVAR